MAVTARTAPITGKAYRTELSPVSFLRRSAYVYPDKIAVVHEERRYSYHQFNARHFHLAAGGAQATEREIIDFCPSISLTTRRPPPSSSESCQRPRPGRHRSTSYANANGAERTNESTNAPAHNAT